MVDSSGQLGLDRAATDHLLTDIHAPELQIQMLHILLDLVSADGRLTPGEAHVVSQAMTRWGLEINSSTPTRERNLGRRPTQVQHLQRAA